MITTMTSRSCDLGPDLESALAAYRYRVFVEEMGWPLQAQIGQERDQFDRPDTLYVIARHPAGELCGCARLLPTTQPYLLDEVFPALMAGQPLPHSPGVWELSRFTTSASEALRVSAS